MKHVFIFDPGSFHDQWRMEAILDSIGQYFRTQKNPHFTTQVSRFPRESLGIIQDQVDDTQEAETIRVYAIGGEKILFDCLNGIAGLPNMELAIVPYGETNDFLRTLGDGKPDPWRNIQAIVNSPTIPTDIISAGNNYALNGCTIGLTPTITIKRRELTSKIGGVGNVILFNQLIAFFNNMSLLLNKELTAQFYKVTIDDNAYNGEYSLINIANGAYCSGNRVRAKGAIPNDGFLDVVLFKSTGPISTLYSLKRHARGKKSGNCIFLQAKKISIQTNVPVWMQLDSEYIQDTNISFEIIPEGVQIVTVNNLTYHRS